MAKLSSASVRKMLTADHRLVKVIDRYEGDLVVIEAHRTIERQKQLMAEGKSSLKKAENGKHTKFPSEAVDIAPLVNGKIYWENKEAFVKLKDEIFRIVDEINKENPQDPPIKLRWGGDWDRDGDWKDEKFLDMVHFEIDD